MKILWAVDAFEDSFDLESKTIQTLRGLARQTDAQIVPVYVLSPDQLGVSLEFSHHWAAKYEPSAKLALDQKLREVRLPGLQKPVVLTQDRASLRATVEALASFAERDRFDLVVVASHGKKGLEKVFLGSFAEQLLLQSRVPVIVVGSQTESFADRQPLRILVPNDLSRPESSFFKNIFQFTRSLKAQATLMSVVTHPIEAVVQSGVFLLSGGWVQVPVYLEAEKTRLKEAAAQLCEQAKAMDVPCEWYQAEARIPVAEAIVQYATESQAGLIAMAAESGAVASALLGSVTRQVIRSAPCPVLVYRVKG